jgi:hybrid cluster-associated redox disulfide protein
MINPLCLLFARRHSALLRDKFFVLEQTTLRMSVGKRIRQQFALQQRAARMSCLSLRKLFREELMALQSHLLVEDVMSRWPATIRVFLDFKLGCVGCPIAGFHDVDDACREHGIDRDAFIGALMKAAI